MDKICIVSASIQARKDMMGTDTFDIIGIYRVPTARFCQKILNSMSNILNDHLGSEECAVVNPETELVFMKDYINLSYDCDDTNEAKSKSYNCSNIIGIEGTDEKLHGNIIVSIVPLSKIYNYRFKYNMIPYSEYCSNIYNKGVPEYSNMENIHSM